MRDLKLGAVESRFAEIIWNNEPIASGKLVKLCEKELNWKKPTTYTVLRKLCERGIFQNENGVVSSKIKKDEFHAIQSEQFIDEAFEGSLPSFLAAFSKRKSLSKKDIEEIQNMINSCKEE
ncbi:MAG: BlaI/MecI/CopY family transcriptional regulator [Eubacterium sp.]|nr:BlaI/MecI/CopY family transcriptional regulator [Eubacterium sp.]